MEGSSVSAAFVRILSSGALPTPPCPLKVEAPPDMPPVQVPNFLLPKSEAIPPGMMPAVGLAQALLQNVRLDRGFKIDLRRANGSKILGIDAKVRFGTV